jgi:hypothetical protein
MPESSPEGLREKVLDFIRGKKGQIADEDEVLELIKAGGGSPDLLKDMADEGVIAIAAGSVFLSAEGALPHL